MEYDVVNDAAGSVRNIEMVYVEGGTFTMGASVSDSMARVDERPARRVTLSGYRIGRYAVTQGLWVEIMGSNPSRWKDDSLPVCNVSWQDVQTFICRLNARTGGRYRLPTEAEWEFAARGGSLSRGYEYSGSDNIDDVAWYNVNSGRDGICAVGLKSPNELGLFDMTGNIWEWCQDWKEFYMRGGSLQVNPAGPSSGFSRAQRGGCGISDAWVCRVTYRGYGGPDDRLAGNGFRLALSE
ncbi:MAG: formylglycine-generating enzyme family protein [Alistipes sp.]|nr:formylglycine-generating enzyme family protein [Alistipes sp.]